MNNTFNLQRFGLLLKKTLLEKPLQMLGFPILVMVFLIIVYAVMERILNLHAAQGLTLIWGLAGGSFFMAAFVFGCFNNSASGVSYLTLPASHLEKWLCAILIAGILYPLVFLIFYRIMDNSFVAIYHNSLDPESPFYKQIYNAAQVFNLNSNNAWQIYRLSFFLAGAMLLGALYFNKLAFIKMALVLCAFFLLVFIINALTAKLFFQNVVSTFPFHGVVLKNGKQTGAITLPINVKNVFDYCTWWGMSVILWLLAYVRLREKEF